MYPVYCIASTGRTDYINQPISLDDNDCGYYLLCWEPCTKNVQRIRFFRSFIISQFLHTDHGIFLFFHPNNVHYEYLYFSGRIFVLLIDACGGYPLSK